MTKYDLTKAFHDTKENAKISIPEDIKATYIAFFSERISELKSIYQEIYLEKTEREK